MTKTDDGWMTVPIPEVIERGSLSVIRVGSRHATVTPGDDRAWA